MSDDDSNFSTRRFSPDEMDELQAMLEKSQEIDEVTVDVTPELASRITAQLPNLGLSDAPEEMQFQVAIRKLIELGLEHLEDE